MEEKKEMTVEKFDADRILREWKAEDVKELLESMDSEISRLKKEVEMYRQWRDDETQKNLKLEKKFETMKTLLEIF